MSPFCPLVTLHSHQVHHRQAEDEDDYEAAADDEDFKGLKSFMSME